MFNLHEKYIPDCQINAVAKLGNNPGHFLNEQAFLWSLKYVIINSNTIIFIIKLF